MGQEQTTTPIENRVVVIDRLTGQPYGINRDSSDAGLAGDLMAEDEAENEPEIPSNGVTSEGNKPLFIDRLTRRPYGSKP